MGMSASCILVRNAKHDTKETLLQRLRDRMSAEGYAETDAAGAKITLRMQFPAEGQWFAIGESEENPAAAKRDAVLAVKAFGTEVISAELVDSDFVLMTLFSADGHTAGVISVGEPYWGRDGEDYDAFAACAPEGTTADAIRKICEGGDVFAEDGFANLGELMDFDSEVLWTEWDETDPAAEEFAVLHFQKTEAAKPDQQPKFDRKELFSGNIVNTKKKLTADEAFQKIDFGLTASGTWKRTSDNTGLYVRLLETENSIILFSNLLSPKHFAFCLNTAVSNVSVSAQDVSTTVIQKNGRVNKKLSGILPREALSQIMESACTTEEAFRAADQDGAGCIVHYYAQKPVALHGMSLRLKTLYLDQKFVYIFRNTDGWTKDEVISRLDAFLIRTHAAEGGIERTDNDNAEGFLRMLLADGFFAFTGNLAPPEPFAYAFDTECLYLHTDTTDCFAEVSLSRDGKTVEQDMLPLNQYAAFAQEHGYDPTLLDRVYTDEAQILYYARPAERSSDS